MASYTITKPGRYRVWATPDDRYTPVIITTTGPDGTLIDKALWTPPTAEPLPGMPDDARATVTEISDVPAGATVQTLPEQTRLIIWRSGDLNAVHDSAPPAGSRGRSLPAPRTDTP